MANMNYYNFRKAKAIEAQNKNKILKICSEATDQSGIYILTREENGFKYAYIGQAKHILTRLAQHMSGYQQHIDMSLKKHKLWSEENPTGWRIQTIETPIEDLDKAEQQYIKEYANKGFQLRNKTSGSQGEGKEQIDEYKPKKGYRDGLERGYDNARKEVKHLFDKHLKASTKSDKPNKNQEKALAKFNDFIS